MGCSMCKDVAPPRPAATSSAAAAAIYTQPQQRQEHSTAESEPQQQQHASDAPPLPQEQDTDTHLPPPAPAVTAGDDEVQPEGAERQQQQSSSSSLSSTVSSTATQNEHGEEEDANPEEEAEEEEAHSGVLGALLDRSRSTTLSDEDGEDWSPRSSPAPSGGNNAAAAAAGPDLPHQLPSQQDDGGVHLSPAEAPSLVPLQLIENETPEGTVVFDATDPALTAVRGPRASDSSVFTSSSGSLGSSSRSNSSSNSDELSLVEPRGSSVSVPMSNADTRRRLKQGARRQTLSSEETVTFPNRKNSTDSSLSSLDGGGSVVSDDQCSSDSNKSNTPRPSMPLAGTPPSVPSSAAVWNSAPTSPLLVSPVLQSGYRPWRQSPVYQALQQEQHRLDNNNNNNNNENENTSQSFLEGDGEEPHMIFTPKDESLSPLGGTTN